jgi:hypothetical protein
MNKLCSILILIPSLFWVACSSSSNDAYRKLLTDATRQTSKDLVQSKVRIKYIDTQKAAIYWIPSKKFEHLTRNAYNDYSNRFVFIPTHNPGFSSITGYLSCQPELPVAASTHYIITRKLYDSKGLNSLGVRVFPKTQPSKGKVSEGSAQILDI